MQLSALIDWISVTARGTSIGYLSPDAVMRTVKNELPLNLSNEKWVQVRAHNGYKIALQSESGVLASSNPSRQDMGVHFTYSGSALSHLSETISGKQLIENHSSRLHRFSRVDVAIDIVDSEFSIETIAQHLKDGKAKTYARTAPNVDDKIDDGHTQYVGSMKNRTKLLKIYNKAFEQKIEANWKRVEFSGYGDNAVAMASKIENCLDLPPLIQALIVGYCDFPEYDLWSEIMGSNEVKIAVPEKEKGNTRKWLLEICAKALAKEYYLDNSFMHEFMDAFNEQLNEIESEFKNGQE